MGLYIPTLDYICIYSLSHCVPVKELYCRYFCNNTLSIFVTLISSVERQVSLQHISFKNCAFLFYLVCVLYDIVGVEREASDRRAGAGDLSVRL